MPMKRLNETLEIDKFSEAKRLDGLKTIIYLCLKLENKKKCGPILPNPIFTMVCS